MAVLIAACRHEPVSPALEGNSKTKKVPSAFPEEWGNPEDFPQITFSTSRSGDKLSIVMSGKKQTFKAIVAKISDRLLKPVEFSDGIVHEQILEGFKIEAGSWVALLELIAKEFNCKIVETPNSFLVQGN